MDLLRWLWLLHWSNVWLDVAVALPACRVRQVVRYRAVELFSRAKSMPGRYVPFAAEGDWYARYYKAGGAKSIYTDVG